jgi:microcompartment protein CcmK/EutM
LETSLQAKSSVLAVQEGFSAMTAVGHTESPIDAAVVGVVDVLEFR